MARSTPLPLTDLFARLVVVAVVLAVGLQVRPVPLAQPSSDPVASVTDQSLSFEALKVGERLEPRVFPAPVLDRLPTLSSPWGWAAIGHVDVRPAPGSVASECHAVGDLVSIVKHVPRMERGDPPRI